VARRERRHIASVANYNGMREVLVQMVDILDDPILERAADADVVEDREMLHVLAQANATGVRTDGDAELGCEEQYGDHFVHAAQPAAIDLAKPNRVALHELLEHDTVLAVFARRDADRRDRSGNCRMA